MGGDGCAAVEMYLMLFNCTLKTGQNGKFCYIYSTVIEK